MHFLSLTSFGLPARFNDAGQFAFVSLLPEDLSANTEESEVATGSASDATSVVAASLEHALLDSFGLKGRKGFFPLIFRELHDGSLFSVQLGPFRGLNPMFLDQTFFRHSFFTSLGQVHPQRRIGERGTRGQVVTSAFGRQSKNIPDFLASFRCQDSSAGRVGNEKEPARLSLAGPVFSLYVSLFLSSLCNCKNSERKRNHAGWFWNHLDVIDEHEV